MFSFGPIKSSSLCHPFAAVLRSSPMKCVAIVGFGFMGEAIAAGLRRAEPDVNLLVMEPVDQKCRVARDRYGARIIDHPGSLFEEADISVLAVKPQVLPQVLPILGEFSAGKRFVSVAAGVPLVGYSKGLQTEEIVRFMPNLAATVGSAVVAICHDDSVDRTTLDYAFRIADAIGERLVIPERLMSAVTGVSGSGIAYVFALAHAMALGGTRAGLPYKDSLVAAIGAIRGAAELMQSDPTHPIELLTRVTSPGGTTIEGVAALEAGGFTPSIMRAVAAAVERADELEKG